jgi:hypothetical protein
MRIYVESSEKLKTDEIKSRNKFTAPNTDEYTFCPQRDIR